MIGAVAPRSAVSEALVLVSANTKPIWLRVMPKRPRAREGADPLDAPPPILRAGAGREAGECRQPNRKTGRTKQHIFTQAELQRPSFRPHR